MTNRIAVLMLVLTALLFGPARAQSTPGGSMDLINPLDPGDSLTGGAPYTFQIAIDNSTTDTIDGLSIGFRVYTNTGQDFEVSADLQKWQTVMSDYFDGGQLIKEVSVDGAGADTIGFGGFGTGIPPGETIQAIDITVTVPATGLDASYLCLDSSFFPPAGQWLWAGSSLTGYTPDWDGPYCYPLAGSAGEAPQLDPAPPTNVEASHCQTLQLEFTAYDPDTWDDPPFYWAVTEGIGTMGEDDGTGTATWSYTPSAADVGASRTTTFIICECEGCTVCSEHTVSFTFTNQSPLFTSGCDGEAIVYMGNSHDVQMIAEDTDCDGVSYSVVGVTPTPVGSYSIDANSGVLTFNTADGETPVGDGGVTYAFTIRTTDDAGGFSECATSIDVLDSFMCGDLNGDSVVNIQDLAYGTNYLFNGGPEPIPSEAGDVNCDSSVNIPDMTYLVTYLFDDGPIPCANCP